MDTESQLATAALDTLHGARGLPPGEAAAVLQDFLNSLTSPVSDSPRVAQASGALQNFHKLKSEGSATDDDWQSAITTMLSLANQASD